MGSSHIRLGIIVAATMAVIGIVGCSQQAKRSVDSANAGKIKQVQEAAQRQKQIAQMQLQIKQHKDQSKKDEAAIPVLLGQSDVYLKQAQQYKDQAANAKDSKARKKLQDQAAQAQANADAKADVLVQTRQDFYAQIAAVTDLQNQIETMSGKDKIADQVVAGDAHGDKSAKKSDKSSRRSRHDRQQTARNDSGSQM